MNEHRDSPDVRQLLDQELPRAAFPAPRSDFRVYFDAEAHARIVRHAGEDKSVEICGVLVGRWEQDDDGPFTAISECIRCDNAAKKAGEVTFTHDAWTQINREMDTRFVDLKIVGWYHSHPGFGVFLSERDVFIHEHFFSNPGQVAFVVDPRQETEGVFAWSNGKPKPCTHYWVGSRIQAATDEQQSSETPPEERVVTTRASEGRPSERTSLLAVLHRVLPLIAVFLIGYFLAGIRTTWEEQRLVEGTVAHFGLWKGLRPGLRERLAEAADHVKAIRTAVGGLANRHIELAGEDAAAVKDKWDQISRSLHRTEEHLDRLGAVYGFNEAEMAAMRVILADKLAEINGIAVEKTISQPAERKAGSQPTKQTR